MSTLDDEKKLKAQWKRYRNHKSKNAAWVFLELYNKGATKLEDFKECVNDNGDHTRDLDLVKQISIYTDCYNQKSWSKPLECCDKETAEYLNKIASVLCKKRYVTIREIEIWAKIMKGKEESKTSLRRWYDQMQKEGLLNISEENVSKFLGFENFNKKEQK